MATDTTRRDASTSEPGTGEPLALFPLHAVLVPGASMGLRIFEPRYLELVSHCGRNSCGFGVCLILDGDEAGTPAAPAGFGTEALIEDFGTAEDGLLSLRVRGARRFHTQRIDLRSNGLQFAEVIWSQAEPVEPVRPEHGLLVMLLERLLEHAGGEHAKAARACFDDAAWVGWRLAELLPLQAPQRQYLLQLDDPHHRLDHLLVLLPDV